MKRFAALCLALLVSVPLFGATGTISPSPIFLGLDLNGNPISGGKVCAFVAGTTTPIDTYTDVNLTVPNSNPVILNSAGQGTLFLTPGNSYKFILKTAGTDSTCNTGSTIWTQDNIAATPTASNNLDVLGTAGETLTAGNVVYLSDGSGSKTAGLWYKADSANTYSSTLPQIGLVPNGITSGAIGSVRIAGQMTGLSSLTVGTIYYVGTAASLTSTPPSNSRAIGVADTTSSLVYSANPPSSNGTIQNTTVDGRLTLTTALPVTTADVTGATSIYFTPFQGNRIALYNGTSWNLRTFSELTLALGTLTSGLPYDVFVYDNAGVVTLRSPVAWTNATTRATALIAQDGVLVKTGATTDRYLGTFYTTATTTTEDSAAKRFLWNYYHRMPRSLRVVDTTNTWTYSTDTYQQANGSAVNQVDLVIGVADANIELQAGSLAKNNSANVRVNAGIGEDAITLHASTIMLPGVTIDNTRYVHAIAWLRLVPAVGRHYYTWLERTEVSGTTTWAGDNGDGTQTQSGLTGRLEN